MFMGNPTLWKIYEIDLIPERVGSEKRRELFRNGATADFTLPKITSQNATKPHREMSQGTQTIDIRYRHDVPGGQWFGSRQ